MKNKLIYSAIAFLVGCGPDRDFEDKNIFGSQTVGGVGTSSSSGGGSEPPWPMGDSGVKLSQVIPEGMNWEGFRHGQTSSGEVKLQPRDWYDPTGERGTDAVMVVTTKHQCEKCAAEAGLLAERISTWKSEGRRIKVVVLIVDTEDGKVATPVVALKWRLDYYLVDADVGVDPLALMLPDVVFGMPYHTIVDPRNMTVVGTQEGIIGDYKMLEGLADAND